VIKSFSDSPLQNLIHVELVKNSNLVGLFLVWIIFCWQDFAALKIKSINIFIPYFHQVKFQFFHPCPLDGESTHSNILYKWKHQVEHHPSKTSDYFQLLFLEVCESVWILYELNLVDEQHIGSKKKKK
jgi:hypothetical protein